MMKKDYYYWMDTTESWNPKPVGDVILYRGEYNEDGEKDRDNEEEILAFNIYNDAGVDIVKEKEFGDLQDDIIYDYIERELGFVPDYEVN